MGRSRFSKMDQLEILEKRRNGMNYVDLRRNYNVGEFCLKIWRAKHGDMTVAEYKTQNQLEMLKHDNFELSRNLYDCKDENKGLRNRLLKSVVRPAAKRDVVNYLKETYQFSERRACRILLLDRSSCRYKAKT